jgi:anti-sigma B factor antagonist
MKGGTEIGIPRQGVARAIVTLPDKIDVTNADEVYDQMFTALTSGAAVIVADLTATTFCDSAGLRRLAMIHRHAANREIQVRLAVSPGGPVRRLIEQAGLDQSVPVYASLAEAARLPDAPVAEPRS